MVYKGSDLDLRTPYPRAARDATWSEDGAHPGAMRRAEPARASAPIAVDDAVLAACNVAHDAAAFLGAGQVAVVHLVHALTRVDAAREVLEHHGVGVQPLRHGSAVAIAAQAPAPSGSGTGGMPRASPELEQLLRRAAARAGAHGAAASVSDVLRAVLGAGREQPAAALLLDAATDPDELARWGTEPPAPAHAVSRAASHATTLQAAAVDQLVARVGELEATVRALAAELGRAVAGLAERLAAIRAVSPDGGTDLPARMSALEATLSAQPAAIADAVALTISRQRSEAEAAPAAERLSELEALLHTQTERMEEASRTHERDLSEIFEAIVKLGTNQQTLAANLEAWRLDSSGDVSVVANRLEAMERALRAILPRPRAPAELGPPRPAAAFAADDDQRRGFRRWLDGTGRVLPASWREDMNALRETLRLRRRDGQA